MEIPDRDVFIVHSESDKRDAALVEALTPRLCEVGIQVWQYEDWSWEHRIRRRGKGAPRASGRLEEVDYPRYLAGDPMPFRAPIDEIDEGTLAELIHGSRVVVLSEPSEAGPTEGVFQERRLIARLAEGRILLHLIWPGSDGAFFEELRPTVELKLTERMASPAVVDEVFAAVAKAWIVYNLQWKHGRQGGHLVLQSAVECEASLRHLVEHSPRYQEPEESTERTASPEMDRIAAMFANLRPFEASQFEEWWTEHLAKLRSEAGKLREGPSTCMLRALIAAVDRSWRDAFGPSGS